MRKILFFFLSLLFATYLLVAFFHISQKSNGKPCEKVEISIKGDTKSMPLVSKKMIWQEINEIAPLPLGKASKKYNTRYVEQTLLSKNALIAQCNLFFRPSGTLSIHIETQYPLFLILSAQGSFFVSQQGKLISTDQANAMAIPLPVVYGHVKLVCEKERLEWKLEKPFFEALKYILQHPKWGNYFSDFYIDNMQNLYLSGAVAGFTVEVGNDYTLIADKLQQLELFLKYAEPKFGAYAFKTLNLLIPGKVIATPRDKESKEDETTLPVERKEIPSNSPQKDNKNKNIRLNKKE